MTRHTDQVFDEYRNLLFSVAYRILGSAADAEDAVQDAWVKWSAADRSQVTDPKAYLVRIVSNVAMDRLRSAQARRETYVGPWLPEPILTSTDTADDATAAESVSVALLVVLEALSPLERAVFVLKEAFGFSYAEIADAVERSEDTVRQAAARARRNVQARRPRFHADRARQRQVTERFFAAAGGGDINTLMQLLAPDVTLWTDGGGKVRQAMHPVVGAERVAAWFAAIGTRSYQGIEPGDMGVEVIELNGGAGIVCYEMTAREQRGEHSERGADRARNRAIQPSTAGRVIATLTLDLDDAGRIVTIHNVANPDKLHAVASRTTLHIGPDHRPAARATGSEVNGVDGVDEVDGVD
ncbi:RNA polymerase sigma factor SigJ [Goodfellowiella coeruleoviolacea]|uniref:RNA polymerase sigma-70 factor, ECF subfamily n=1 Tax=Goodfellowiella coeruleoviolacea TaxID=334858 RepID=A0AAE3KPM0_9PSEU|nr:RNA polymerase sigma factor SigJ [Goodfellowiella coeruleoviolacea]MCP2170018.1 RNA polymerase sigma-70 factor, ECF subfamily [Goodfellowiella coeruleoviolacea]